MSYRATETAATTAGLIVMGALHDADTTLVLLGAGRTFWPVYSAAPEALDGLPDPIDRWSLRVIGGMAKDLNARALYPFGGPPFQPFISWAKQSRRAHQSPVGMLVHDTVGMMISYRGALRFDRVINIPLAAAASPCDTCVGQPCTTACPVDALAASHGYDLAKCHAFLDTDAGQDCMINGCAVRRACPISQTSGRDPQQSAHHMKAFHRR